MTAIPNFLTSIRLILAMFMFVALAAAAGGVPWLSSRLTPDMQFALERWAFWAFLIAAITDFFDGWLARKMNATSDWGAILDPIADKVLICGAILGLMSLGPQPMVALPAGLILFREFAVSALREVGADKGVKLPVTVLAKWKTTLQILALASELLVACWAAFQLPADPAILGPATTLAHTLLWLAAAITLITGAQYWEAAHRKLRA